MPADADPLLDGRLVLLVDDDPTVLEVCRSYLEQAGFRVHEAADAFTAPLGTAAASAFGDNWFLAATALIFGSAILGAFIDNIPYTATMTPVVEGMVAQTPDAETGRALWWSFALGACFGGNGTAIAASANVVAIGIAQRAGHPITFWKFTKYGIVVTLWSATLAWAYVWLRYF